MPSQPLGVGSLNSIPDDLPAPVDWEASLLRSVIRICRLVRTLHRDRSHKPVAPARHGLDVARGIGIVAQSLAQFSYRHSQTVVELDERVLGPEALPYFFPGHDFARAAQPAGPASAAASPAALPASRCAKVCPRRGPTRTGQTDSEHLLEPSCSWSSPQPQRRGQILSREIALAPQLRPAPKPLPDGHFAVNAGLKSSFIDGVRRSAAHLRRSRETIPGASAGSGL